MACPRCGCKVHYQYNDAEVGPDDEGWERCAACGVVFPIEDSADEEDDALREEALGALSQQTPVQGGER